MWAGVHQMAIFLYKSPDLDPIPSQLHQDGSLRGTQPRSSELSELQPSLLTSLCAQAAAVSRARSFCSLLQEDKGICVHVWDLGTSYPKTSPNPKCSQCEHMSNTGSFT